MKLDVSSTQYETISTALNEMIADREARRAKLAREIYLADAGWEIDPGLEDRYRAELPLVEGELLDARSLFVALELQSAENSRVVRALVGDLKRVGRKLEDGGNIVFTVARPQGNNVGRIE
jgi:hypothetical protein